MGWSAGQGEVDWAGAEAEKRRGRRSCPEAPRAAAGASEAGEGAVVVWGALLEASWRP